MKKGIVFAISLIIVLIGLFGVASEVEGVKASGTIYIRTDGSIDPPTVPISTDDNVTYTFTDNINDSIVIERSHIIIEGVGYTLNGTGTGELIGLTIDDSYNVTIQHVNIEGFGLEGEFLPNTTATILLNNTSYNTIYANTITNNDNYYGIWLENSSSNTISGNNITNNHREGLAYHSIRLRNSPSNTISGNNITNNDLGIWLCRDSNHNSIFGNNITNNNYYGIWLDESSSNSISGNSLSNNEYGIFLEISSSNTISGNNITNNNYNGISLLYSSNNFVYHNNFINNTIQAYTDGSVNVWDDGTDKGNYWSDYEERYPNATEIDGSGIWNTSYVIDENNQDNYPIVPEFPTLAPILLLLIVLTVTVVIFKRRLLKTPIH